MRVVFRSDASLEIGSGHVMRCLTLARGLRERGADCHFICREHRGHMITFIKQQDFTVHALPEEKKSHKANAQRRGEANSLIHEQWLGVSVNRDVRECKVILDELRPEWLVVDHYAIDKEWELALNQYYKRLMVIDDLADREHHCDLLLDQNLGRTVDDYCNLVPFTTVTLVGPQFALLRPEFAKLREYSLSRRSAANFKKLLISMGGVDQPNATGKALKALKSCLLPGDFQISVIMGQQAVWLEEVKGLADEVPCAVDVAVNVGDMAQRMADSDLAIGAAGSTSWERCSLGLPALMVVLGDNQKEVASFLHSLGAAKKFSLYNNFDLAIRESIGLFLEKPDQLLAMSASSSKIADGNGCGRVVVEMQQFKLRY